MPRSARRLAGPAALLTSLALLAACSSGAAEPAEGEASGAPDLGDLTVQLSWVKNAEFAGEYFAIENGYFADAGFGEVTLTPGPAATETIVASGEALVGLSSPVAAAPVNIEQDAGLRIIGTTYQKNPFTILSLAENAIETPEDLVGKTIGVQTGGNDTLFAALLEVNGIDPADVDIVPVGYDPSELTNGNVDGFFAFLTNEAITVELAGFDTVNLPLADNGLPFMTESFIVTEDSIENEREALKAFLHAEILGWRDAIEDPEESARLAVEEYGADLELEMDKEVRQAEEQVDLISTEETDANGLLTISDELVEANIETLAVAGFDITAEELFDLSLLEEVYDEHPELLE
ncbi:ABC transporter substrate-binding protein [Georgenia muralis]